MPRYRMESGVVVDIPEESAELIVGLTPEDEKPKKAAAKAAPAKKAASKES